MVFQSKLPIAIYGDEGGNIFSAASALKKGDLIVNVRQALGSGEAIAYGVRAGGQIQSEMGLKPVAIEQYYSFEQAVCVCAILVANQINITNIRATPIIELRYAFDVAQRIVKAHQN